MSVFLVRHGNALGRSEWFDDDELRPLTRRGQRQAEALVEQLRATGADVRRVYSSRAERCVATVVPLAEALGLKVQEEDALFEGLHSAEAVALAEEAAAGDGDAVLCTHGDIIPEVLRRLAREGMVLEDDLLCAKSSTWVLDHDGTRFTRARYLPPPA